MLKNLLKNAFALVVFGVLGYVLYMNFGGVWSGLYTKFFPCQSPIVYNLASFDNRFGISKKDFLADLAEAEKIWEIPIGRQLFTYDPNANSSSTLKVNLIYDYRQAATIKINNLGLAVSDTRASYDALRAKYTALEASYQQAKSVYQTQVSDFQNKQNAYQAEVNFWNSKGGAPKNVYDQLNAEAAALQTEFATVKQMESDLNAQTDNINALVTVINGLARTLNINADALNTIGATRGEQFTEGEYKSNGQTSEIDVYEFSTKEKLIRVLAHELGHALGLEHVSDPNAIMYYLNENKNGKLTGADLAELKTLCKIK